MSKLTSSFKTIVGIMINLRAVPTNLVKLPHAFLMTVVEFSRAKSNTVSECAYDHKCNTIIIMTCNQTDSEFECALHRSRTALNQKLA